MEDYKISIETKSQKTFWYYLLYVSMYLGAFGLTAEWLKGKTVVRVFTETNGAIDRLDVVIDEEFVSEAKK